MKKSKLDSHHEWIVGQLKSGSNIRQVRDLLAAEKNCVVTHEALRKWLKTKQIKYSLPKKQKSSHLSFLEHMPYSEWQYKDYPPFLFLLHPVHKYCDYLRGLGHALGSLGIEIDEKEPKLDWRLPSVKLKSLCDLEICFLAYLLSGDDLHALCEPHDMPSFLKMIAKTLGYAHRLKVAIVEAEFVEVGSIFSDASGR